MSKRPLRTELSIVNLLRKGVPKKFLDTTLDDYMTYNLPDLVEFKDFIKEYLENLDSKFERNIGLFMFGSNGVGKSMIASIIIKEAYRHRYTSKRVSFVEYISEYTRIWGMRGDDKEAQEEIFYNDYKSVEFLVLEEVGKEVDSKISAPILEDCLRYREERGLVTIICTNVDPSLIKEKYGNSIYSLIIGNLTVVQIIGKDKRKSAYKIKGGEPE